ncbi:helix-turn-helix transcriptional regulator [Streptomyces curacoi]|uniref:helix-turn-helix transcriptional regulator n=1 Tax=Streptomyces curacoi TaxID=146536 RepID=UPI000A676415|nr:LuxR C-terminal-related transcriptional regulator [Streptomyces curacoi]
MKVLVVEEQEVIRRGLLALLSTIPEVSATTVAHIPARDDRMSTDFDVALISTSALMSAERAGRAVEHLRPVIVIVPAAEPHLFETATRRPADGYVMQAELTSRSLRTALVQVREGQLAVPDTVAAYLLSRSRGTSSVLLPQLYHLSSRGAEVLALLVAGASNKEIAGRLGISIHGVKRHVSALLSQFHSPNRVHLVSLVLQSGVLSAGDLPGTFPATATAAAGATTTAPARRP